MTIMTTATEKAPTHTVTMTEDQWAGWLADLRSGDYLQAKESLQSRVSEKHADGSQIVPDDTGTLEDGYCCLGLLCKTQLGLDLEVAPVGLVFEEYRDHSADGQPVKRTEYSGNTESALSEHGGTETGPVELLDAIPYDLRIALANHNDTGRTFVEIAYCLERDRAAGIITLAVPA